MKLSAAWQNWKVLTLTFAVFICFAVFILPHDHGPPAFDETGLFKTVTTIEVNATNHPTSGKLLSHAPSTIIILLFPALIVYLNVHPDNHLRSIISNILRKRYLIPLKFTSIYVSFILATPIPYVTIRTSFV